MLDEPESFLALRGHRPFMDEVARRALERKLQLVVATHSPQVLSRFPISNIRMCMRGSSGRIRVVEPESFSQVHQVVGMEMPVSAVVLVEDAFAAVVLSGILSSLNYPIAGVDIVQAGGKNDVVAGVRIVSKSSRIRIVGILDADQRDLASGAANLYALPGKVDPEQELFDYAAKNCVDVAAALGRSVDALLTALSACEFSDHAVLAPSSCGSSGSGSAVSGKCSDSALAAAAEAREQAMELAEAITWRPGRSA
ncbi:ATP-binding protein [Salinispora arenicola]|uniref:hypothetical protein n=1 Tax=Salinispora arenicola TaxID=168697 RepID=UPI0016AEF2C4|nr:hypothetical protein [Salinispora arenicola]NIL59968.1 ATP-binding protein [Salinispora arenicola]